MADCERIVRRPKLTYDYYAPLSNATVSRESALSILAKAIEGILYFKNKKYTLFSPELLWDIVELGLHIQV